MRGRKAQASNEIQMYSYKKDNDLLRIPFL